MRAPTGGGAASIRGQHLPAALLIFFPLFGADGGRRGDYSQRTFSRRFAESGVPARNLGPRTLENDGWRRPPPRRSRAEVAGRL